MNTQNLPSLFKRIWFIGFSFAFACGTKTPPANVDNAVDAFYQPDSQNLAYEDVEPIDSETTNDSVLDTHSSTSPCPKAPTINPRKLPADFMPALEVTLAKAVDGDTAHFNVTGYTQPPSIRFLYVNTEESHGDRTTAFGIQTAEVVKGYLSKATKIHLAPHRDPKNPNEIELDDFGRWLALVFVDGTLFQARLVREGWTAYFTKYGCAPSPIHQSLLYSEAEAFFSKQGIWEPNHPTDYQSVLRGWIGSNACRPNPYQEPYCK